MLIEAYDTMSRNMGRAWTHLERSSMSLQPAPSFIYMPLGDPSNVACVYQLSRVLDLVDAWDQAILGLLLESLPIRAISLLAVFIQHRNAAGSKIGEEEAPDDRTPHPTASCRCVSGPPERVCSVVDVPCQTPQTACVWLALVGRIRLEPLPLNFGDELGKQAGDIEGAAD